MSASSQRTKRKLSLLQLAEELGNVSKACQIIVYHRDSFYEIKRAFQNGGAPPQSNSAAARVGRIPTASRPRSSRPSSASA